MQSATDDSLAVGGRHFHTWQMFTVSQEEAAAIRAAFDRGGEFAAAVELRRRFPGISDNEQARRCARTIAGGTAESTATSANAVVPDPEPGRGGAAGRPRSSWRLRLVPLVFTAHCRRP